MKVKVLRNLGADLLKGITCKALSDTKEHEGCEFDVPEGTAETLIAMRLAEPIKAVPKSAEAKAVPPQPAIKT